MNANHKKNKTKNRIARLLKKEKLTEAQAARLKALTGK